LTLLWLLPVFSAGALAQETWVVGIKEAPPFVMRSDSGDWTGLSVELWKQIAEDLQIDYELREYDLTSLLKAVTDGEIDVAVAALTITPEREKVFDFTHGYHLAGQGIAVAAETEPKWLAVLEEFLSPHFLGAVAGVLLLLLAVGCLVWLFERRHNESMFGGSVKNGLGSSFWWAAVTMTTVGYGDKAPITGAGRIVGLIWMFASIVVLSGFIATISSALTVHGLSNSIEGPEDLASVRVASVAASASGEWLRAKRISFSGQANVEGALDVLRQGFADAVVYDAPLLNHLVKQNPEGGIAVLPRQFELQPYAFAVPQGSERLENLNRAMLGAIRSKEYLDLEFEFTGQNW
jgi:ABC-type amino acid transport substrate-binding protein